MSLCKQLAGLGVVRSNWSEATLKSTVPAPATENSKPRAPPHKGSFLPHRQTHLQTFCSLRKSQRLDDHFDNNITTMAKEASARSGIAVGANKGHVC